MNLHANRLLARAALIALTGYVLSGPAGFLLVQLVAPQPVWQSGALFAQHYAVVQDVPYYFGLLLIGGMLMLVAGLYLQTETASPALRFQRLLALALTVAFATLICFNYICQTTFVRHLALAYRPESDPVIATFSMANPRSLAWSIEMWGYGLLGGATWLLAPYYRERQRTIWILLVGNGVLSLLSVLCTVVDIAWVLTSWGLAGYFLWNVLMIVLMALLYRYYHPRNVTSTLAL